MTASPPGTAPTWPRASASSVKPWITYWPSSVSHSVGELPPCVSLPRNVSRIGHPSVDELARFCSDLGSDADSGQDGRQGPGRKKMAGPAGKRRAAGIDGSAFHHGYACVFDQS